MDKSTEQISFLEVRKMADWITAIASVVGASGIVLLWWQIRLSKIQLSNDHERSRRERAIDLFVLWNEFERTDGHLAIAIGERLSLELARAMWGGKPIEMPIRFKETLERFLSRRDTRDSLPTENEVVKLDSAHSLELRSGMIECLNLLETIFTAARHHVADTDLIKEQFSSLVDPNPDLHRSLVRNVREAAGGPGAFPSTTQFDRKVMSEKQPDSPGKSSLG